MQLEFLPAAIDYSIWSVIKPKRSMFSGFVSRRAIAANLVILCNHHATNPICVIQSNPPNTYEMRHS